MGSGAIPGVKASRKQLLLAMLPLLLVVACYFTYLLQHAINVPLADDIYDVLLPLTKVTEAESLAGAVDALYEKHTDHRTIASRLVYTGQLLVTGEVNFRALNFAANLALPLLLLMLYRMIAGSPQRLLLLLPAALVLLQLRVYGITFWTMASFAYFYVFVYGFLTVLLLQNAGPVRLLLATLTAILASFTLASGQMIWLVGLASLALQALLHKSLPRSFLLWWLLAAVATLALWRAGLGDRIGLGELLQLFFANPRHYVLYTLTLLGSVFSESSVGVAASGGTAMLLALCACTLWRWREADLRLELCAWFIVLSVMTMALGRGFATVDYGLSSRYSFPSVLLLATTWIVLASRLQLRHWSLLGPAILLALLFWGHSINIYSQALQPYMEKRVQNFNRGRYNAWPHPTKESNAIVALAIEQGIYSPPARPLPQADMTVWKSAEE
ncbi:MAG: hypothetical protein ABJL54_05800 [Halioglobus sp.]